MNLSAVNVTEFPIVAAFFSTSRNPNNPDLIGAVVPLEKLPEARKLLKVSPCRFVLEGYEKVLEIRAGRPQNFIHIPETHTTWRIKVFSDKCPEGNDLFAYGLFKPRVVAVRECCGDYRASRADLESLWLDYSEPEKTHRRKFAAPKPARLPAKPSAAPRAAPQKVQSGGGSGGTAVTKMNAEERAEYKARLLSKAVLTDRDKRHLDRIEKLEGK